ncbi:MAG: hypothetical protein GF421_01530 [Candidatus Aminicenantes bacterium]|nr:hypothetical protein [Candidatus Aminicenantes bacterium]
MKKHIFLSSVLCFLLFAIFWVYSRAHSTFFQSYELTPILENCAEYCERLSHTSLYFVCMEEVKETINTIIYPSLKKRGRPIVKSGMEYYIHHRVRPVERHHYVYDYQLTRKKGEIKEKRILLREDGKEKNKKNALLKTKRFTYQHVIFGPIGLLSRQAQLNHTYEVIKQKKHQGDRVLIIRATPRDKNKVKHLYGDVWIRQKDSAILKIEWNQQSLKNYQWMKEEAEQYDAEPKTLLVSEYDYEHKGILFPSRYHIKEMYYFKWNPGRFVRSEIEVTYRDYKFFTVETEVKYK